MNKGLSYRDAGVDIDEGAARGEQIKPTSTRIREQEVPAELATSGCARETGTA